MSVGSDTFVDNLIASWLTSIEVETGIHNHVLISLELDKLDKLGKLLQNNKTNVTHVESHKATDLPRYKFLIKSNN